MEPLRHSYTNRTLGDAATVVKRYQGPDALARLQNEHAVLDALPSALRNAGQGQLVCSGRSSTAMAVRSCPGPIGTRSCSTGAGRSWTSVTGKRREDLERRGGRIASP